MGDSPLSGVTPLKSVSEPGSSPGRATADDLPLITTKTLSPTPRASRIPRPRLEALLAEVSERKLSVLRAPGGFGKTTLALSWIEQIRARGDSVAWLSLDVDDNEPRRFVSYVIHALRCACAGIGQESLEAARSAPLHQVQARLVNEIADCDDEIFLFLDDFHAVTHEAIQEFVSFLLRHAPANLRLVLLSRSEPPLELGSLRARGELLEIDAARLRFTQDETREFLGTTAPSPLTHAEVQSIHGLTEGWPAALRITALSFGEGRDPAELLRSLARSRRSIGGFLDELCASLPPDLLEFLERTSIVDRLSASLCNRITGRQDSAELLARLDSRQLVTRLDDAGQHFACHQLFREYLLQRLERRQTSEFVELHRRASEWYQERELDAEAVKHLLAAGDTVAALARITQSAGHMLETGDLLTLLNLERQLRSKFIQQPVTLQLAITWAEALSLSSEEALAHVATIESSVASSTAVDADAARRECLALRAVASGLADDPAQAAEWLERYDVRSHDRALVRGSVYNVARYVAICAARWDDLDALPHASDRDVADTLPAVYEANLCGIAELAQGRSSRAEQCLRHSVEVGRRVRQFAGATGMAKGPYAELLYETGRFGDAETVLRDGIDVVASGVSLDTVMRGLLTAARLAVRRRQPELAAGLLDRAEAIGLTRDWPRLVAAAVYWKLRLQRDQGLAVPAFGSLKRLQQMRSPARSHAMSGIEGVSHYFAMGQALVDLDQRRPRQAVTALAPLFADAVTCGANLLAIRLGALLSRAHLNARAVPQGLRVFRQVLDLAQPSGFVCPIADEGPEVMQLLELVESGSGSQHDADRRHFTGRLRELARGLWGEERRGSGLVAQSLPSPLTPREREILELIAEGQSNKAMARQLGLAPETIKTHLKHVFAKLGVERRTQAVLRARELGLVSSFGGRWHT
jgi:LuxR family maltose regulon positive regulatory protein